MITPDHAGYIFEGRMFNFSFTNATFGFTFKIYNDIVAIGCQYLPQMIVAVDADGGPDAVEPDFIPCLTSWIEPALAALTAQIEEVYFSGRLPDESILPQVEANAAAAIAERAAGVAV